MELSFNTSISGIHAAIKSHAVTAHDIANINTTGYEEGVVHQVETTPSGTAISQISKTPNTPDGNSNTDLAAETGQQVQNKEALSANTRTIKVQDRMIGTLLDMVG